MSYVQWFKIAPSFSVSEIINLASEAINNSHAADYLYKSLQCFVVHSDKIENLEDSNKLKIKLFQINLN